MMNEPSKFSIKHNDPTYQKDQSIMLDMDRLTP